jgi:hypothetical protein
MLPTFYQTYLQSQLSETEFATLEILVELLQKERRITIERLATLFPQPILFESRRRNLQRFLSLPQMTPEAVWFPNTLRVRQRQCEAVDQTTDSARTNATNRA